MDDVEEADLDALHGGGFVDHADLQAGRGRRLVVDSDLETAHVLGHVEAGNLASGNIPAGTVRDARNLETVEVLIAVVRDASDLESPARGSDAIDESRHFKTEHVAVRDAHEGSDVETHHVRVATVEETQAESRHVRFGRGELHGIEQREADGERFGHDGHVGRRHGGRGQEESQGDGEERAG